MWKNSLKVRITVFQHFQPIKKKSCKFLIGSADFILVRQVNSSILVGNIVSMVDAKVVLDYRTDSLAHTFGDFIKFLFLV